MKNASSSLEAYDYFLRSLEFGERPLTKETTVQARQMCERALEFDRRYAAAYARLGFTYWLEWFRCGGQDETLGRATELVQKAVALDESLPGAYVSLGWVYLLKNSMTKPKLKWSGPLRSILTLLVAIRVCRSCSTVAGRRRKPSL